MYITTDTAAWPAGRLLGFAFVFSSKSLWRLTDKETVWQIAPGPVNGQCSHRVKNRLIPDKDCWPTLDTCTHPYRSVFIAFMEGQQCNWQHKARISDCWVYLSRQVVQGNREWHACAHGEVSQRQVFMLCNVCLLCQNSQDSWVKKERSRSASWVFINKAGFPRCISSPESPRVYLTFTCTAIMVHLASVACSTNSFCALDCIFNLYDDSVIYP